MNHLVRIYFTCLLLAAVLIACKQKAKQASTRVAKPTAKTKPHYIENNGPQAKPDSIALFDLGEIEPGKGDTLAFISLSDVDALPGTYNSPEDSVDALTLPNLKTRKPKDTQYILLTGKYRKRLLQGTGFKESDSLFVYDYANDVLKSFSVSSLTTYASLSPYETVDEGPHHTRDYMFGVAINRDSLSGFRGKYFTKSYAYIGKENPFTRGQMHPVVWKKTDPKNIPPAKIDSSERDLIKGFRIDGTYTFEADGFHFYLREYLKGDKASVIESCNHIIITDENGKVCFNQLYAESEGSSPAPMSFEGAKDNQLI